jgi:tetratricopeptide (TPR) repeat protein
LLNTDWYIDQIKRKAYDSDAVPLSFTQDKYRQGKREQILIYEQKGLEGYQNIREMIDFVASDDPNNKFDYGDRKFDYFPSKKFRIPVDSAKVVANGTVPKGMENQILPYIDFEIDRNYILKAELMILDLLATNNWERPVYFAVTVGDDSYIGLQDYFQLEGLAYRLVPIKTTSRGQDFGRIDTDIMYNNMMNKFAWGGIDKKEVYMDENNNRMTMNLRSNFDRLASALIQEGKKDSAIKVVDRAFEVLPENNVPYNFFVVQLAEDYYQAGSTAKADKIMNRYAEIVEQELTYYFNQKPKIYKQFDSEVQRNMSIFKFISDVAKRNKRDVLVKNLDARFRNMEGRYMSSGGSSSAGIN